MLATIAVAREAITRADEQRKRAESDALTGRPRLIKEAAEAFSRGAAQLRLTTLTSSSRTDVPQETLLAIRGAEDAMAALLRHPVEIGPDALLALTNAAQTAGYWRSSIQNESGVIGVANGEAYGALQELIAQPRSVAANADLFTRRRLPRQARENPSHHGGGDVFACRGSIIQVHRVKSQGEDPQLIPRRIDARGVGREEKAFTLFGQPTESLPATSADSLRDSAAGHAVSAAEVINIGAVRMAHRVHGAEVV